MRPFGFNSIIGFSERFGHGNFLIGDKPIFKRSGSGSPYIIATGGTVTYDGDYKIHTFNGDGVFNVLSAGTAPYNTIEYLVVGGGGAGGTGGGGGGSGGGGGAGGYKTASGYPVAVQSYAVTVGAGGAGVAGFGPGNNGSDSEFDGIVSLGGGAGGSSSGSDYLEANDGASGGGAGGFNGAPYYGNGTVGQGNNGGPGRASGEDYGGGGGGGAGAAGANAQDGVAFGGVGLSNSITGAATYYAGGGGGGIRNPGTPPSGGAGGGGAGGANGAGISGTSNLGGGGGGGGNSYFEGGDGGSGVVIIRYYSPALYIIANGGTVTQDGDYRVHTFTGNDTLEVVRSGQPAYNEIEYLIVGGGGGGGRSNYASNALSGGGGAGGYLADVLQATIGNFAVVVGAGGQGALVQNGVSGGNSSLFGFTAIGGGFGAGAVFPVASNGGAGGSGGGGACLGTGGAGTALQGNDGGDSLGQSNNGGGGGGAGGAGNDGVDNVVQTPGGVGLSNSITGAAVTYATGGRGTEIDGDIIDGADNTGNGGAGFSSSIDPFRGGNGGSGVVIVRYYSPANAYTNVVATGGTISYGGGFKIHTFDTPGEGAGYTFNLLSNPLNTPLNRLIQGGGGAGGGGNGGGGGGAGWTDYITNWLPALDIYAISVGGGAAQTGTGGQGADGDDSVIAGVYTSPGGGGGAAPQSDSDGRAGGNGGGSARGSVPGVGTPGFDGGSSSASAPAYGPGGGGGSSENGGNGNSVSDGNGGDGISVGVTGYSEYYGGGGAAGNTDLGATGATGGLGGGGDATALAGGNGEAGTGGGGAGASAGGPLAFGGAGASGKVVISYPWNGPEFDYEFTIETLNSNVSGVVGRDSGMYFVLDDDTMLLAYGWNNNLFTPNNVTDEAFITNDGVIFTPIDNAPDKGDHAFGFKPGDGYAWFVGGLNTGPIFIHKLNLTTLEWTRVSNSVILAYALSGYYYDGYIHVTVSDGSVTKLYRAPISDPTNFVYYSTLPSEYTENSCFYVNGSVIRYGGGGLLTGPATTNLVTKVYESTDGGLNWAVSTDLGPSMMGLWNQMLKFGDFEFYFAGYNSSDGSLQGNCYYRFLNGQYFTFINFTTQLAGNHAMCAVVFKNKLFVGFGSELTSMSFAITQQF